MTTTQNGSTHNTSPNSDQSTKSVKKILIYLEEHVARGCGHIGIIFIYADQSAEQIYQSAENPNDKVYRLLLLKQPVRLIFKRVAEFRYIYQLTESKTYFALKTAYGKEIRAAVNQYKSDNKPYSSLTNNCCHFIHFILDFAPDVKKKIHILPKRYFSLLKKINAPR